MTSTPVPARCIIHFPIHPALVLSLALLPTLRHYESGTDKSESLIIRG